MNTNKTAITILDGIEDLLNRFDPATACIYIRNYIEGNRVILGEDKNESETKQ